MILLNPHELTKLTPIELNAYIGQLIKESRRHPETCPAPIRNLANHRKENK